MVLYCVVSSSPYLSCLLFLLVVFFREIVFVLIFMVFIVFIMVFMILTHGIHGIFHGNRIEFIVYSWYSWHSWCSWSSHLALLSFPYHLHNTLLGVSTSALYHTYIYILRSVAGLEASHRERLYIHTQRRRHAALLLVWAVNSQFPRHDTPRGGAHFGWELSSVIYSSTRSASSRETRSHEGGKPLRPDYNACFQQPMPPLTRRIYIEFRAKNG